MMERRQSVVEVNSETDFVAKNEKFQNYVAAGCCAGSGYTMQQTWKHFWLRHGMHDTSKTVNEALAKPDCCYRRELKDSVVSQQVEENNGFVADYIHMAAVRSVFLLTLRQTL